MSPRPVVAVVGAGFSGLLTTLHLLSDPDGPQVRLIERRGVFARGLAYATDNPDHLLNVRVANMSAYPDQPDHFVRWLSTRSGWRSTGAFVTRGVYGDYLQSLLREAVDGAFGVDRLLLELDEAVDLRPLGSRWRIETGVGRAIVADAVVLALGALPPAEPPGASPQLIGSARYVGDPWSLDPDLGELGGRVLLIGTGLTMIDVALALAGPRRRLTAISRRGRLPQAHAVGPPAPERPDWRGSPLGVLSQVRARAAVQDWREVVDELRGSVRGLWMSWTQAERRRFLRHLRPWWDIHRHRMAPPVARRIEDMRRSGELTVRAGALQALELDGDGVRVEWRPRGGQRAQVLRVEAVVNCTGHGGDLGRAGQRLVGALLARDPLRPDPGALGADVDTRSRPLGAGGAPSAGLYAVGPLTRGAFWEITSVPDIRLQAAEVARDVLAHLRGEAAQAAAAHGAR